MAERRDRLELTQAPSPRKIARALRRGFWPRSHGLSAACGVLVWVIVLQVAGLSLVTGLIDLIRADLGSVRWPHESAGSQTLGQSELGPILPGLGLIVMTPAAAALLASAAQIGIRFNISTLAPDFGRLSPIRGLSRFLSVGACLGYMARLILGVTLLCISLWWLWVELAELNLPVGHSPEQLAGQVGGAVLGMATKLAMALVWVGLTAYLLAWWQWWRQMRMSRPEREAELRDTEGNRLSRSRRRERQREMASRRSRSRWQAADSATPATLFTWTQNQ